MQSSMIQSREPIPRTIVPRLRFWWGAMLLVCLVFSRETVLSADETPNLRDQVQDLVRRLDSQTMAERTRAERNLLDLGPAVLSKLPAVELIESVSARESLKRIRLQLERRAAKDSSGPSHVTLQGDFSLSELLKQMKEQTGNEIDLDPTRITLPNEKVTVNWNKSTFWASLDELCEQNHLQWNLPADSATIVVSRLNKSHTQSLAVQRIGPFRLEIQSIEIRNVVGQETKKLLRVNGLVSVEPRIKPLSFNLVAADFACTMDGDQPVVPWNPGAKYEHPVRDGGREVPVSWDFSLSDGNIGRTLTIRGRIDCRIAAAVERVVFDQTSQTRGTIRRRGGVSVRLRDVNFSASELDTLDAEIGVSVSYDTGGPAFESHKTWMFHNSVYLETRFGVRTSFTDFDTTQQSDGAIAVDYRWKKIAAPASQYLFVYEAPTLIIDVPLEIDVPKIAIEE